MIRLFIISIGIGAVYIVYKVIEYDYPGLIDWILGERAGSDNNTSDVHKEEIPIYKKIFTISGIASIASIVIFIYKRLFNESYKTIIRSIWCYIRNIYIGPAAVEKERQDSLRLKLKKININKLSTYSEFLKSVEGYSKLLNDYTDNRRDPMYNDNNAKENVIKAKIDYKKLKYNVLKLENKEIMYKKYGFRGLKGFFCAKKKIKEFQTNNIKNIKNDIPNVYMEYQDIPETVYRSSEGKLCTKFLKYYKVKQDVYAKNKKFIYQTDIIALKKKNNAYESELENILNYKVIEYLKRSQKVQKEYSINKKFFKYYRIDANTRKQNLELYEERVIPHGDFAINKIFEQVNDIFNEYPSNRRTKDLYNKVCVESLCTAIKEIKEESDSLLVQASKWVGKDDAQAYKLSYEAIQNQAIVEYMTNTMFRKFDKSFATKYAEDYFKKQFINTCIKIRGSNYMKAPGVKYDEILNNDDRFSSKLLKNISEFRSNYATKKP